MKKKTFNSLAIFGGKPLFEKQRPIGQLDKPPLKDFLSGLREAYDARWLTNGGRLVQRVEKICAKLHGVLHCLAVTNAGIGISILLRDIARDRKGEVILPGFSFRGLPHFIRWAGLTPRFVDVDKDSHALDLSAVKNAINKNTIAILAVSKSHSFGDREGLCALADGLEIPLIFDSVYALGAKYRGSPAGGAGLAEVFSLHATKLINGFEGGYITTNDGVLVERLQRYRNFGLGAPSHLFENIIGTNGKLNEVHAAMALASLPYLNNIVAANRIRFQNYLSALEPIPHLRMLESPQPAIESSSHVLNVLNIEAEWPLSRNQMWKLLSAEGLGVTPYYSPPLSRIQMNPSDVSPCQLPVSEKLAEHFLQLPSGKSMSEDDIKKFAGLCSFLLENAKAVKKQLEHIL